jgi:hypothetical protein
VRYVAASLHRGIFPKEDAYVQLGEKLEPMKNISLAIKLNKTLRSITPPLPAAIEKEVIATE